MLPRILSSTKSLLVLSVFVILLAALISLLFIEAEASADGMVLVTIIDDNPDDLYKSYLMAGTISPAERVEVSFQFARRLEVFTFGAVADTASFESTFDSIDVLIGVTARALYDGEWSPVDVIMMSATTATVEAPTATPRATLQPWTPSPTATSIVLPSVTTAPPTITPTRPQPTPTAVQTESEKIYLPHVVSAISSGE